MGATDGRMDRQRLWSRSLAGELFDSELLGDDASDGHRSRSHHRMEHSHSPDHRR